MRVYECDRCGKCYKDAPQEHLFRVSQGNSKEIDLCPSCKEKFEEWVRRKARKKKVNPEFNPSLNGGFVFGEVG